MTSEHTIYHTKAPPQHADIHAIDAKDTYLFGSRGSLKTWLAVTLYILRRVYEMPRSTGAIVGISFEHMNDNTLPPVKSFLASRGFVEGIHFVVQKRPPDHWPKPYAGVLDPDYKHVITWCNGTNIQLISLNRKASANGVSAQWAVFDEVKFMNETELVDEIFPIVRPIEISDPLFKNCSGYLSKFFSTDKNADPAQINWLLKKRELVDHKKIDLVKAIQYHVFENKMKIANATKKEKDRLEKTIAQDELRLAKLRSNLVYVSEINAVDVKPILGDKWFQDKKRNTPLQRDWDTIYMNIDPLRPGEVFYPAWDANKHTYVMDDDVKTDEPLIISCDYQHTVSPIPIAQITTLPGRTRPSLNFVDSVYTLHPQGLSDAVTLFCNRYSSHGLKLVYYVYDHTAKGERVDAQPLYLIVKKKLEDHGWYVMPIDTGQAPRHYQKYTDSIEWMTNENDEHMDILVNKLRCPKMIKSIEDARATTVGKETKKDKKPETDKSLDQSETPHFSDAFDMITDAVLKQRLINSTPGYNHFAFR